MIVSLLNDIELDLRVIIGFDLAGLFHGWRDLVWNEIGKGLIAGIFGVLSVEVGVCPWQIRLMLNLDHVLVLVLDDHGRVALNNLGVFPVSSGLDRSLILHL